MRILKYFDFFMVLMQFFERKNIIKLSHFWFLKFLKCHLKEIIIIPKQAPFLN